MIRRVALDVGVAIYTNIEDPVGPVMMCGHGYYSGLAAIAFTFNANSFATKIPHHPFFLHHVVNTFLSVYAHEHIHFEQDSDNPTLLSSYVDYWGAPENSESEQEMTKYWSSPFEVPTCGSDIALRILSFNGSIDVLDDRRACEIILHRFMCPILMGDRYSHITDAIFDEARIAFNIYSNELSDSALVALRGENGEFEQAQLGPTSYPDTTGVGGSVNWRIAGRCAEFDFEDQCR